MRCFEPAALLTEARAYRRRSLVGFGRGNRQVNIIIGIIIVVGIAEIVAALYLVTRLAATMELMVRQQVDANERHARQIQSSREEVTAMTEAIARTNGMQIVFPKPAVREPSTGWFDGKPKITKFTNDAGRG